MESFRKRMQSQEYEQDDSFLPSDNVWNAITDELDDKPKRRKPFVIFFSSCICIAAFISLLIPKIDFVNDSSFTKIDLQNSKQIEILNTNKSFDSKTIATEQNNSLSAKQEIKSNSAQSTNLASGTQQLTKAGLIDKGSRNNYNHHHSSSKQNAEQSLAGSPSFSLSNLNTTIKSTEETDESLSSNHRDETQGSLQKIDKVYEQLSAEISSEFIGIQKLPNPFSFLHPDLSVLEKQPAIVSIQKASIPQDWIVGVSLYASISNYSISNYSGFDQIDFSLKGKASYGYQFTIEKRISDKISLYAGIGLDHAHFDANYLLTIDADDLSFASPGQQGSSAKLSKIIPSLAGGLSSSFVFDNISSDLRQAVVDLSLAHDFKTITFPVGARFLLLNSSKFKGSFAFGVEYSKRLLSIDTGINSLTTQDGEVELLSVSAVDRDDQPFTIHNVNASALLSIDYQLSNRMSVGLQSGFIKPLSNVYQDDNYKVNTYQLRGGVSLKYAFAKGQ